MSKRATFSEHHPPVELRDSKELLASLLMGATEAEQQDKLNVVFITAENGNTLNIVVGGQETVLGFVYGHGNPPYYASKGDGTTEEPFLTCYASLEHHTEYPRNWVIPMQRGIEAALEFFRTSQLPGNIPWIVV